LDKNRTNKRLSVVPSIADILFVSVFLLLALRMGQGLLSDADTGYHIRAGEYILETHTVPKQDIFSYTTPPLPWTAHEWLSEVIMAVIHKAAGLTGLVTFFSFVIAFTYYLLFRILRAQGGNILTATAVMLLVVASSQIHWLARPHIFSLLLLVLWYFVLDEYQYRDKNYLYIFPPVMLLWVNLHGGFIIGLVLIGVYLVINLLKALLSFEGEKIVLARKTKALGLALAACLLVSIVNPDGYHILLFPFKLTSSKFIMDRVSEFLPPNFHEPLPFKYLFFFMLALLAVSPRRLNLIELALLLLFTNMALYSARYIPLFAIMAAPVLLRQFDSLVDQWDGKWANFVKGRDKRLAATDASARGFLWPVAALLLVGTFVLNGELVYRFDKNAKAVEAVEFMKETHLSGNMFNNDEIGDYIIYASWPDYRVFFDGRSDMYGVDRIKEYEKVTGIKTGWEGVLEKYDVNWIIFNTDSVLSRFLLQRDDWKLIYADKVASIFIRNIPENREVIDNNKNTKPYKEEEGD